MRITRVGQLAVSALILSACGTGGGRSPTVPTPPTPVNLAVLVSDSHVSVSPRSVGAGPVVFTVTNQASHAESLAIRRAGGSTLASTAPINPQGTTQVSVNLQRPGRYTIATSVHARTDAERLRTPSIHPVSIRIGRRRRSGGNALLAP
ncbi:MAG: hypothetical protein WAL63_22130 [Solirubrobacteraceae bacterium]